jgi:protein arginine N-methyltransferase 1
MRRPALITSIFLFMAKRLALPLEKNMSNTNNIKTIDAISANESDGSKGQHRMSYRDVAMHKVMLQDIIRTEAYEKSIAAVVKPAHRVLDFGCGSGVLSMFAARANAAQVTAVDRSPFIKNAQNIAFANGFENITFYHDDHESLQLDERVDVIVSEWMGHCLFYEAMLEPLLTVRDRCLAEGGIMIPAQVSLHVGLVSDEEILDDLSFLQSEPYGLDFSPIAHVPLQQSELVALEPDSLLESVGNLGKLDMHTISKTNTPRVFTTRFHPSEKAQIYALCGWFSTQLSEGVEFGTGPNDIPTHWDQILFPLPEAFTVDPSRELTITLSPQTEQVGKEQFWCWSISDAKKSVTVNEQQLQQQAIFEVPQGKL